MWTSCFSCLQAELRAFFRKYTRTQPPRSFWWWKPWIRLPALLEAPWLTWANNFINFLRLLKFSSPGDMPQKQPLKSCWEGHCQKILRVMFFSSRTQVLKFSLTSMGACSSASPQHSKYSRENNCVCQVLGLVFGWVCSVRPELLSCFMDCSSS